MSHTAADNQRFRKSVTVTTGARLHFGLLTHRPQSGREFGGLGVMVDSPGWEIRVSADGNVTGDSAELVPVTVSDAATVACPETDQRVRRTIEHYFRSIPGSCSALGGISVSVDRAIPGHRGLGSGTQLGLAIGKAISVLTEDRTVTADVIAERTGRGLRSAVGTWGFESGGLIVDGGKLPDQAVGTCVSRVEFPSQWRFLLVAPVAGCGLSGADEVTAFERLRGMPIERSERLCRLAMMELLPAIVDADITAASEALTEFGRMSGEYFSSVQGGIFADDRMISVARTVTQRGRGFFQTSWGPTCAALCRDDDEVAELQHDLQSQANGSLVLSVSHPLNHGATVTVGEGTAG
ncbi:MAG: GHMP family kinase ATP-binding protein [Planctomycetota bacterium]|jgi:beta-RFAP synthase